MKQKKEKYEKSINPKAGYFEKTNKIYTLVRLIRKKAEKTQIITIRNERAGIAINIKKIIREYYG